jgi:copper chaperone
MIRLKVTRMNCGGCAKSVTRAVLGVDPNATVDIDLGEGIVSIASSSDAARFTDAVRSAGYGAEPLNSAA